MNAPKSLAPELADAYADASFEQGLNQRTEDPAPEKAREALAKEIRRLAAVEAERDALRAEIEAIRAMEPVAWLVCSVNNDGSLSLKHAAAWREAAHAHINDAITEYGEEEASSWVVRPVYTLPPRGTT